MAMPGWSNWNVDNANSLVEEKYDSTTATATAAYALAVKFLQDITNLLKEISVLGIPDIEQLTAGFFDTTIDDVGDWTNPISVLPPTGPITGLGSAPSPESRIDAVTHGNPIPAPDQISFDADAINPIFPDPSMLGAMPSNPITDADLASVNIPSSLIWNYNNEPYVSDLLNRIQTRLRDIIINGGGGLSDVEIDMFARETERDALVNADEQAKVASEWSKRGFELPAIGLFNKLSQINREYQNKRLDKSRAIAEESRKTEIQMEQFALGEGSKLEGTTIQHHDTEQNRKLEAAKAIIQYGLAIVEAQLKKLQMKASIYTAELQAYSTKVEVFKSLIAAESAKIEAQTKVMGLGVAVLTANVESTTKVVVANAQITTSNVDADTKIGTANASIASSNVEAQSKFGTMLIQAKGIEYESYSKYNLAVIQARMAELESHSKYYQTLIQARGIEFEAKARTMMAKLQAITSKIELGMKNDQFKFGTLLEGLKTQAQVVAQICASALSSFHASAATSVGVNLGTSQQVTYQDSTTHAST